jgi:putative Holliday junction resolvase
MTSYLGIDYGTKRIGIAAGDDVTRLASPITTLAAHDRTDRDAESVASIADDYGAAAFVLGLPLNMDGTEGPQAKLVRAFGAALAKRTGMAVHYVDERLSSYAADDLLRPADLTRKKKKNVQDAVAAAVILQSFLSEPEPTDETDDDDQS